MDLMNLYVRIGVDTTEYDRNMRNATQKASTFGDTFKAILSSNIITKVFSLAVDGAKKATRAFVDLVRSSVDAYANYQQLVGGVETLFGAGGKSLEEYAKSQGKSVDAVRKKYKSLIKGQETVLENAKNAWKTAGVDANTYMEQATSFSAALIQGLNGDTHKAAKITDMAIQDMSDNMNKMGTPLESIQNAYQAFAKQNYMLLDNLKLGYGGTKTEMERLLADAEKLSGVKYDIKNLSDVYEAIHVIQENLGITGTTAEEAEKTVSGSMNQLRAAWENFKTGLGDPDADIGALIDNLVSSFETAAENLIPVVGKVLEGIGEALVTLAPIISEKLPEFFEKMKPGLETAMEGLGNILSALISDFLPTLFETIKPIIQELLASLWESLKETPLGPFLEVFEKLAPVIGGVVAALAGLKGALAISSIVSNASNAIGMFTGKLGGLGGAASSAAGPAASAGASFGTLAGGALKLIAAAAAVYIIAQAISVLVDAAIRITEAGGPAIAVLAGMGGGIAALAGLMAALGPALTAGAIGIGVFGAAMLGIGAGIDLACQGIAKVVDAISNLVEVISSNSEQINSIVTTIGETVGGVITSIADGITQVVDAIGGAVSGVLDSLAGVFDSIGDAALNAGTGFEKLVGALKDLTNNTSLGDLAGTLISAAKGIKKISKAAADAGDGASNMEKLGNGIKMMADNAVKASISMQVFGSTSKSALSQLASGFKGLNLANSMKTAMDGAIKAVNTGINALKSLFAGTTFRFNQHIAVPHFSMSGTFNAEKGTVPSVSTRWYRSAEDVPYLFKNATLFGAGEGKDEVLYGREALMKDIKAATGGGNVFYVTNNFDGVKNAEQHAEDFLREIAMRLRTA